MEYLASFFTHSGAVKYEKFLKESGVECTLLPIPRKLSSSCGIGAKFQYNNDLKTMVTYDINKIYLIESGEYKEIYTCE